MTVKHLLEQKGLKFGLLIRRPRYCMPLQKWLKKTSVLWS